MEQFFRSHFVFLFRVGRERGGGGGRCENGVATSKANNSLL